MKGKGRLWGRMQTPDVSSNQTFLPGRVCQESSAPNLLLGHMMLQSGFGDEDVQPYFSRIFSFQTKLQLLNAIF